MSRTDVHHLGEDLLAMVDGGEALGPERRRELTEHLSGCADCRAAVSEARQVLEALARIPALEPSAGFDRALSARLDALEAANVPLAERLLGWLRRPVVWAPLALAGAAVATAVALRPSDELDLAGDELEVAQNLEFYQDLELFEDLDVAEDLDVIAAMEEGDAG